MKPDTLDRKIIRMQNKDGRCSSLEIARQLDVSEGTVRNRLKKMSDAGLLRIPAYR
jgi:Lrp/AsnC family transcriptional regulator, regulator for asnA, asnC and gidA